MKIRSLTQFPSRRRLDRAGALAYQHPALVARHAKKHALSLDDAQALFERCKAFLVACALMREPVSPTQEVDEMWHHFILHTIDYAQYCDRFFGHFLHHVPEDDSIGGNADVQARLRETYATLGVPFAEGESDAPALQLTGCASYDCMYPGQEMYRDENNVVRYRPADRGSPNERRSPSDNRDSDTVEITIRIPRGEYERGRRAQAQEDALTWQLTPTPAAHVTAPS